MLHNNQMPNIMEQVDIQPLIDNYSRKMAKVPMKFKRYLYKQINWNVRMIGIKGARGVGKTTLLMQHIVDTYKDIHDTIYASLDDLWFQTHSLMDLVDWADRHGINRLYLDEVHRYPNWALTLKNIYDSYPDISIVYTSSSILNMDNSVVDLSRRQTVYMLYGLSFREFLEFENIIKIAPLTLPELIEKHVNTAMDIIGRTKIAALFEKYLTYGYYPFYKAVGEDWKLRLRAVVNVVIENDLPAVESVSFDTIQKIKKLLMLICQQVPFVPNMSILWKQLETNNDLGLKMLYALDKAQILTLLTKKAKNYKQLCKPDKIFLNNTSLMHALCSTVDKGNERETFFMSMASVACDVQMPENGDFLLDGKYLFEVGGHKKTFAQIKDIEDSFLAVDDTEIGYRNRIPLWMFGFLY